MSNCPDLQTLVLRNDNDLDYQASMEGDEVDYTDPSSTFEASIIRLLPSEVEVVSLTVTVTENIVGSLKATISFSRADMELIKTGDIFSVTFSNGSGKHRNEKAKVQKWQ